MADDRVRVWFYVRTAVEGGYRYDRVPIRSFDAADTLSTPHPPAVGDLVGLPGGQYVVVARSWMHSEYGSVYWPLTEPHPKQGPMLQVIVEPSEGPFVDQVVDEDDGEDTP